MNAVSLLYRSFYDTTLADVYIKKGKGVGMLALLAVSVFVAFLTALKVYFIIAAISYESVAAAATHIPDIEIAGGKIVAPSDYEQVYISPDETIFVKLDTTGQPVSLYGLPRTGIYISTDSIISVNPLRMNSVPLEQVLGTKQMLLDQEKLKTASAQFLTYLRRLAPLFVFVFHIPNLFFTYLVVTGFILIFSFLVTSFFPMAFSFEERMRLTVLSSLPIFILSALSRFLELRIFIGGTLGALIVLVYMYSYIREMGRLPKQV